MIRLLLNLAWVLLGGFWMVLGWLLAGVILAVTIVGLPWARAAFAIGAFTLLPFRYQVIDRQRASVRGDPGTGALGVVGNIIWFVLAGWWLAAGHVIAAIALAVTVVGLPFAWAHLKLARLALWPIGKAVTPLSGSPKPPKGIRDRVRRASPAAPR
jgi:uncharacterized membrane protein YccF (DUF307 family)